MPAETKSATPLGELIKNARQRLNLTQEDLAQKIRIDVRSIQRWEEGKTTPRPRRRRALVKELKLAERDIALALQGTGKEPVVKPTKLSTLEYETLSLAEVQRRGFEAEFAMREVDEMLGEWPLPPGPHNDMGDAAHWLEIAKVSPATHFCLFEDGVRVVAHWSLISVDKGTYARALAGENVNKHLRAADVVHPVPGDRASVYFIDLVRRKRINPVFFLGQFFRSMSALLDEWARLDIAIDRIVAHLSTHEVINMAERRIGFEYRTDHKEHTMFDRDGKAVPSMIYELELVERVPHVPMLEKLVQDADAERLYLPSS